MIVADEHADELRGMDSVSVDLDSLTPAQRRFAQEAGAETAMRSLLEDDLVFLYRADACGTHRWLVDADGHVRDSVSFHRGLR